MNDSDQIKHKENNDMNHEILRLQYWEESGNELKIESMGYGELLFQEDLLDYI